MVGCAGSGGVTPAQIRQPKSPAGGVQVNRWLTIRLNRSSQANSGRSGAFQALFHGFYASCQDSVLHLVATAVMQWQLEAPNRPWAEGYQPTNPVGYSPPHTDTFHRTRTRATPRRSGSRGAARGHPSELGEGSERIRAAQTLSRRDAPISSYL